MKRVVYFGALAALAVSCDALAIGGIAQVMIIDRKSGVELTPHLYHGEYWVAGTPGDSYAIEIRNRLGERLLAVTSVDGVNVISGATASWDQTGYVFDPGQGYQITGWRKSDAEVAEFTFTDSPNSYAERTGRPANVGVIGVALFRERRSPAVSTPQAPAPEPSADKSESAGAPRARPSIAANAPKLGTGHGEREVSYVNHTEFPRLQTQPNEVIRIRYDSFDNLVAMGVIERPHPAVPTANPFPASAEQHYVPDPPRCSRRPHAAARRNAF
jgi:hypothetical protein